MKTLYITCGKLSKIMSIDRYNQIKHGLCGSNLHGWNYDHHIEEFRCYYCGLHFGNFIVEDAKRKLLETQERITRVSLNKQCQSYSMKNPPDGIVSLDMDEEGDFDDYDFSGKHC